jgi:hypothetical protein
VVPWNYTTATQELFQAGFSGLSSGVSFGTTGGPPMINGSGAALSSQACDLIPQYVSGTIGGTGDYIEFEALQDTGGTIDLLNTSTAYPYVTLRMVAVIGGTAGLTVPACPSWPAPPAYITSTFMNTNVRNAVNFLSYPPVCKAVYTAGTSTLPSQSFPAGTIVPLGTVTIDNYSGFSVSTHLYTAPVAGNYFCYGQVCFNAVSSAYTLAAGLSVNGGTISWGDAVYQSASAAVGNGCTVRRRLRLNAGDTVGLYGQQSSGGAVELNTSAVNQTRLIVCWEGS